MKRRYPLLIEFRKDKESWKHLFIRMVHILALLDEKYGIPYIPTKGCDPEKLLNTRLNIYNEALLCAAVGNHLSIAKYLVENKNITNISSPFNSAARHGSIEVMKYLYGEEVSLGLAMISAIEGEQLPAIKFLQEKEFIITPAHIEYIEEYHRDKGNKTEMLKYMRQFI